MNLIFALVAFFSILHGNLISVFGGPTDFNNAIPDDAPRGRSGWMEQGRQAVQDSLAKKLNVNRAKNVVLFIADGLSLPTVAVARILKGQLQNLSGPEQSLIFEKFPYLALSKTYQVDKQVPDSSGTATAILSGVKTNYGLIGFDENVKFKFCSSEKSDHRVASFLTRGSRAGKRAGVVTTTRVTHATPASAYAHSASRYWERFVGQKDSWEYPIFRGIGDTDGNCTDIAQQLVENDHGIDLIMGGGRQNFLPTASPDPVDAAAKGKRPDGRDMSSEWRLKQESARKKHAVLWNKEQLDNLDEDVDKVLGLFAPSHIPFEGERDKAKVPSLAEMTEKAIKVLSRKSEGFFLLVEAGRIDHGHHNGKARQALEETLGLDEAVNSALRSTNPDETLVIVTSDHSHVFAFGGYPQRNNPIYGFDNQQIGTDDLTYTPLLYGNGPGFKTRRNLTIEDVSAFNYKQDAAVPTRSETHGGEDVPIYATGPFAHLFSGVVEQNFVAHAILFASCVADFGEGADHCPPASIASKLAAPSKAIVAAATTTAAAILLAGRRR